jgi:hypothetical protein
MTRDALKRVLAALAGESIAEWQGAESRIAADHEAVLRLLTERPDLPVYGFSTLLGHLDDVDGRDSSRDLLRAHLLGPLTVLEGDVLRLISACKAEQLSHGGSGVSPDAYRVVRAAATETGPAAEGSWTTSYGSGDVVPAAWWMATLLGRSGLDPERPGEVIALINGTFVSTAATILAGARLADAAGRLLSALDAASGATLKAFPDGRQRPVSLRDPEPVVAAVTSALADLGAAADRRLAGPSANPLFEVEGAQARPRSQSSFLDYRATWALTAATQATLLAIGAAQRIAEHVTRSRLAESPDPALVQPPKVLQAILERALVVGGALPGRFSGADSDGVEDLRDLSLISALRLLDLVADLEQALPVLAALGIPVGADPRPTQAFLGDQSDPASLIPLAGRRWTP